MLKILLKITYVGVVVYLFVVWEKRSYVVCPISGSSIYPFVLVEIVPIVVCNLDPVCFGLASQCVARTHHNARLAEEAGYCCCGGDKVSFGSISDISFTFLLSFPFILIRSSRASHIVSFFRPTTLPRPATVWRSLAP